MKVKYLLVVVVALFAAGLLSAVSSEAEIDPKTIAGLWLFDENDGDFAEDISGNGNDGVIAGGPEWVDGKFGNALKLDGVVTHVNCGNGESLHITEEITVVAWVKFNRLDYKNGAGGLFTIAAKGYPDSLARHAGWWFSYDNRNNGQSFNYTCFGNRNGGWAGGGNNFSGHNFAFTNGEWYHLAITVGESIAKLYINGTQVDASKILSNLVLSDTSMNLTIGSAGNSWYFAGVIDEVAIFDIELREEDIQTIMNEGLEKSSGLAAVDRPDKVITTFTNVAREAGLWEVKRLKSLTPVWGDYDNDGDLDLYVTHGGWQNWEMEADVFYRNNGDGTFTDVTAEAGLDRNTGDARHAGFLDYDNDGYLDLYVSDDNMIDDNNVSRILLHHNNGNGTFTDETKDAGIEDMVPNYSWSSTFADFDNDGDLDIYAAVGWGPNVFYENEGDGQFTDATRKAGLGDTGGALNMASGDYDNDGDIDIYVSNGTGLGNEPPAFYRNNGDGTFTDVAKEAGLSDERNGRGVAFFDYDNDNDLDLCIGAVLTMATRLYRNNGDGTFTDVSRETGFFPGGSERLTVGDYDNDGYMDILTMSWSNEPRKLYHNDGDGTFTEMAREARVNVMGGSAGGMAFVDYDNDGDLDLHAPHRGGYDYLYRNNGNDNHWLHIKLVGTETNRDGVGARVLVKAGKLSMMREVNPGCGGARHSLTAHFGLGGNAQADRVEIRWPSGPVIGEDGKVVPGRIEVFENVPADRFIMIEEGSGRIVEIEIARTVQPQGKLCNTWGKVKVSELHQNYPNPFNPETWIPFSLSEPEHVIIRIYSSTGQLVRTLDLGQKPSGAYLSKEKAAYWDGRNEEGELVASDVYFCIMQAVGESTGSRKMVMAR